MVDYNKSLMEVGEELGAPGQQPEPQKSKYSQSLLEAGQAAPETSPGGPNMAQTLQDWGQGALDTGIDVAKSAGVGAGEGLMHGLTLPGDIHALPTTLGIPEEKQSGIRKMIETYVPMGRGLAQAWDLMGKVPTYEEAKKNIEQDVTGEFYKPKTRLGKFAESAASVAADPVSYLGPGGLGVKAAMAAGSGLVGEGGAQAGELVGAEGEGRFAGSLVGALLGRRAAMGKNTLNHVPDTPELFQSGSDKLDIIKQLPVDIKPRSAAQMVYGIANSLHADGFLEPVAGTTRKLIDGLAERIMNSPKVTFNDIDATRKALGVVAHSKAELYGTLGPMDAKAASMAIRKIDDWMVKLKPHDFSQGGQYASQIGAMAKSARDDWAAAVRSRTLDDLVDKSGIRAAVTGTGANKENVLRQEFGKLWKDKKNFKKYSPEEQDLIKEVATGTFARNQLRYFGKLAPTGIVSMAGDVALGAMFGHPGAGRKALTLGIAGAGLVSKKLAEKATQNAVDRAKEAVRMRSPLYRQNYVPPVRRPSIIPSVYEGSRLEVRPKEYANPDEGNQ